MALPDKFDLTPPLQPNDGRLKLLWIDDLFQQIIPKSISLLEDFFAIKAISHPQNMSDLLNLASQQPRQSAIYDRHGLPFDVYLTDFRLRDTKGSNAPTTRELEEGLDAPSGGFLLGLLTALRWPDHPQIVIPYSAYDDEFGQIWILCKRFCPSSLRVLWDETVTKGTRDQGKLLDLIPSEYRSALTDAFHQGILHLPLRERERWESLVQSSTLFSPHQTIEFSGNYGIRPIKIGALFYDKLSPKDKDEGLIPATAIQEFLEKLPKVSPEEWNARKLTETYWILSHSELSRDVYSLIMKLQRGEVKPGDLPINLHSSSWFYPWLWNWKERYNESAVKLTVLFLLIWEHAARLPLPEIKLSSEAQILYHACPNQEKLQEFYDHLIIKEPKMAEKISLIINELSTYVQKIPETLGISLKHKDLESQLLEEGANLPWLISERDILRLINPFPENWNNTPLSLSNDSFIGKAFYRSNFSVKELLKGNGNWLEEHLRSIARNYARELIPNQDDWPDWLK